MSSVRNSRRAADTSLDVRALTSEQLVLWEQKIAAIQDLERDVSTLALSVPPVLQSSGGGAGHWAGLHAMLEDDTPVRTPESIGSVVSEAGVCDSTGADWIQYGSAQQLRYEALERAVAMAGQGVTNETPRRKSSTGQVEDVAVRLTEHDMVTFTEHPIRDALYLVKCNHCAAVVKDIAFRNHMDKVHGGKEAGGKLLLNLQRLAQSATPSAPNPKTAPGLSASPSTKLKKRSPKDRPIPRAPALAAPAAPGFATPKPSLPAASPKKPAGKKNGAELNLDAICGVEIAAGRSKSLAELLRPFNINIKDIPPKKPRAPDFKAAPKPPLPIFKPMPLPLLSQEPPRPLAITTFGARRFGATFVFGRRLDYMRRLGAAYVLHELLHAPPPPPPPKPSVVKDKDKAAPKARKPSTSSVATLPSPAPPNSKRKAGEDCAPAPKKRSRKTDSKKSIASEPPPDPVEALVMH